jgi:hypothetical protein
MDDFEGKAVQRKMFALYERREFPFAEKLVWGYKASVLKASLSKESENISRRNGGFDIMNLKMRVPKYARYNYIRILLIERSDIALTRAISLRIVH